MFDLGVHPHCVCQCAKLYLLNEQEGCCLCSSHWKGGINLLFVAHVLWEKEAGFRETKIRREHLKTHLVFSINSYSTIINHFTNLIWK